MPALARLSGSPGGKEGEGAQPLPSLAGLATTRRFPHKLPHVLLLGGMMESRVRGVAVAQLPLHVDLRGLLGMADASRILSKKLSKARAAVLILQWTCEIGIVVVA